MELEDSSFFTSGPALRESETGRQVGGQRSRTRQGGEVRLTHTLSVHMFMHLHIHIHIHLVYTHITVSALLPHRVGRRLILI